MILLKISLDKNNLLFETVCLLTPYQVLLVCMQTSTPSLGFLGIPLSLRQCHKDDGCLRVQPVQR